MSSKLKKIIIIAVVVVILAIGSLVVYTTFSKTSAVTINDLRIRDAATNDEIFEKEVFLTAPQDNKFDVSLDYGLSTKIDWIVYSSDENVAKVTSNGKLYTINYFSAGKATITARPYENDSIVDSFVLIVRENYPAYFEFDDIVGSDKKFENYNQADNQNTISIFADENVYNFHFDSSSFVEQASMNHDVLNVVDDYNKNVFESVYIDPISSVLVIKAKKSENTTRELITVQSKKINGDEEIVIDNYTVIVNVKGYYISDIQLQVSSDPSFGGDVYILGEGFIKENEKRIDKIIFTEDVKTVYVKIRIVYTNNNIEDITKNALTSVSVNDESIFMAQNIKPSWDFYRVEFKQYSGHKVCVQTSGDENSEDMVFDYLQGTYKIGLKGSEDAYDTIFYRKVYQEDENGNENFLCYEYIYWDLRFARDDAITVDGKIVGFVGGDPGYASYVIEYEAENE